MADCLHVQVIVPPWRRTETLDLVEPHPATSHVVLIADAARQPVGDVILFEVAREASNEVLTTLEALDRRRGRDRGVAHRARDLGSGRIGPGAR